MKNAPDLDPLPENVDGHVVQSYEHQLYHEIPWGQVAIGVGLLALAYVVYQHLDSGDDQVPSADVPTETNADAEDGDLVTIDVSGGGGLLE